MSCGVQGVLGDILSVPDFSLLLPSLSIVCVTESASKAWKRWWFSRSVVSDSLRPYGPYGSSVHEILQARRLEWVAMPSARGSSQLRDQTLISCFLHGQVGSLPLPHLSVYMGTTSFSKFA